jgi:hypothetical protein
MRWGKKNLSPHDLRGGDAVLLHLALRITPLNMRDFDMTAVMLSLLNIFIKVTKAQCLAIKLDSMMTSR